MPLRSGARLVLKHFSVDKAHFSEAGEQCQVGGLGVPVCEVEMRSTFQRSLAPGSHGTVATTLSLDGFIGRTNATISVGSGKEGPPVAQVCGLALEAIPRPLFPSYGQDFASPHKPRKVEAEGDEVTCFGHTACVKLRWETSVTFTFEFFFK